MDYLVSDESRQAQALALLKELFDSENDEDAWYAVYTDLRELIYPQIADY